MSSTVSYGPDAALPRTGRWVTRGLIKVWEGPKPAEVKYVDEGGVIACTKCNAPYDQGCKAVSGGPTSEHTERIVPRLCHCGQTIAGTRRKCDTCVAVAVHTRRRRWVESRRKRMEADRAA